MEYHDAGTSSYRPAANSILPAASHTAATRMPPTTGAAAQAAGNRQFSTEPSGTTSSIGANLPSLQGTSQKSVLVMATPIRALVLGNVELTSLLVCGLVPVTSSVRWSAFLVSVQRIWRGMALRVLVSSEVK